LLQSLTEHWLQLVAKSQLVANCDSASQRAEDIHAAVNKAAKSAMQAAQQRQKHIADTKRQPVEFAV